MGFEPQIPAVISTNCATTTALQSMSFQLFDREKYGFIEACEVQNNNTDGCTKTSLSLAGLRIDERGGIYLNPLLDSNSAYFK